MRTPLAVIKNNNEVEEANRRQSYYIAKIKESLKEIRILVDKQERKATLDRIAKCADYIKYYENHLR